MLEVYEMIRMEESIKLKAIENLTSNLVVLRMMLHLSQSDLAELIGMGRQTLVAIENRKRRMTWSVFLSLVFVFYQNKETRRLLEIFDIYTDELKAIYNLEK